MTGLDWGLPDERASTSAPTEQLLARRVAATPATPQAMERVGGIDCIVRRSDDGGGGRPPILYFHGGGYRLGTPAMSVALSKHLGGDVVIPDYRLAPEHPFPAGLRDATAVYAELLQDGAPSPIVAGDSAGGGLAAALTVACLRASIAVPTALILISPWLDLTCTAESFSSTDPTTQLFPLASAQEAAAMYLQGHPADDPLVSPLHGELAGFPPTAVFTSADETLRDDSIDFVAGLARAGVPVSAHFEPGVAHAWLSMQPDSVDGRLMSALTGFLASF